MLRHVMMHYWMRFTASCRRARLTFGGRNAFAAAILLMRNEGEVRNIELTPAQEAGMRYLQELGLVRMQPPSRAEINVHLDSVVEEHDTQLLHLQLQMVAQQLSVWHRNCSWENLHHWVAAEGEHLRLDPDTYVVDTPATDEAIAAIGVR